MTIEEADTIIDEFFIKDEIDTGIRIRNSIILQIKRDLQFLHGIGRTGWIEMRLSAEQETIKKRILPLFAPALLFCTGIDVLARASNKRTTASGENGPFFKDCAQTYFEVSTTEAEELWKFRNAVTHQYSMQQGTVLFRAGSSKFIEQQPDGSWFIFIRSMYTNLDKAILKVGEAIKAESEPDRITTATYLKENGFFSTQKG